MKSIKRSILLCLCALLTLTTSACQSEEAFNWSQLTESAGATATPAPAVESGALTVAMPTASGALDPLTNPSAAMQGLLKLSYESLLRLDDRYQPELWLAGSVTRTADGGLWITVGDFRLHAAARDNAHLFLEVPRHGGHAGFVSRGEVWYSERRVADFLSAYAERSTGR